MLWLRPSRLSRRHSSPDARIRLPRSTATIQYPAHHPGQPAPRRCPTRRRPGEARRMRPRRPLSPRRAFRTHLPRRQGALPRQPPASRRYPITVITTTTPPAITRIGTMDGHFMAGPITVGSGSADSSALVFLARFTAMASMDTGSTAYGPQAASMVEGMLMAAEEGATTADASSAEGARCWPASRWIRVAGRLASIMPRHRDVFANPAPIRRLIWVLVGQRTCYLESEGDLA